MHYHLFVFISTVSSGLNSLSAVILMDIVTPLKKQAIDDKHAAILTRVIAIGMGLIVIGFTFIIANVEGNITQVCKHFEYITSNSLRAYTAFVRSCGTLLSI